MIAMLLCAAFAAQDTVVIRQSAPAWGADVAVTRELRIGVADGPPVYALGEVTGIAVGADSSIFVVDAMSATVRRYDAKGKYIASFGRRGGGPGELSRPEAAVISRHRLIVRDPGNGRFAVFPLDGSAPEHWQFRSTLSSYLPMTLHGDGGISTLVNVEREGQPGRNAVVRYTAQGLVSDTIPVPTTTYTPASVVVKGGAVKYSIPFTPVPHWTFLPDGSFVGGIPSRPALVRTTGAAAPRRLDRPAQPVAVPSQQREEMEAALTERIRTNNDRAFTWNGPQIPATKPSFSAIFTDLDGRVWVKVPAPSRRIAPDSPGALARYVEPAHFDVYTGDLGYLGRLRLSETFRFYQARGAHVWGVEQDADGVEYVVRYRITAVR